jgi:hypothetical protein
MQYLLRRRERQSNRLLAMFNHAGPDSLTLRNTAAYHPIVNRRFLRAARHAGTAAGI